MRTKETNDNAMAVLFNRTCIFLLSLLYNNVEKSFYLREIARKIDIGAGTVQRELSKLVDADLVVRRVGGKQTYYTANVKSHIFKEMRGLIIKTFGVADVIKNAIAPLATKIACAFIYGSQAEGTAVSNSDIDLMVVGRISEMELHKAIGKAEKELGKTINYSLFASEEFKKRKKEKGGFVARVTKSKKIMLVGGKDEI